MSFLHIDDPCILFALPRESAPFRGEFRPTQAFPGGPCPARFCGPAWLSVLVVETGVGQACVARVLDWLLAKPKLDGVAYEPKLMIFAGFAGALDESLRLGEIVLADEVVDEHGGSWRATWPNPLPDGPWTPPLRRGKLLTVDRLIATPEDKRRLGQQHGAIAVEMEAAYFAARCTRAEIPFACVRATSDELATPISRDIMELLEDGVLSPWRVLGTLLRRPTLLRELLRLRRDTNHAARQLGIALGELLTLTLLS